MSDNFAFSKLINFDRPLFKTTIKMKKITLILLMISISFLNACKSDEPVMANFEFVITDEGKVTLKNTSLNADSYEWDFGNGDKSLEMNPIIKYAKNGDYSIVLISKGKKSQDTKIQKITIINASKSTVKFSFKNTGNGLVQFTNESLNAESFKWTFGNGLFSIEKSPLIQYPLNGTFEIKLEATNFNGITESKQNIIIADAPKPVVKFSYISLGNGIIQFTNESTNVDTYKWTLGNGGQSAEKSPQVHYIVNGTFEVKLEATNFNGTVETKQNVTIADAPKPVANFSINYGSDGYVSFTNLSNNADSFSWTFGNGATSTSTNPGLNYSSNNNYSVTLTARNRNGENTISKTVSVSNIYVPTTGQIVFFTNFGSIIKIYINNTYYGSLTKYLPSGTPSCNTDGLVTITLPQGAYSFTAQEDKFLFPLKWAGTINVVNGQCKAQQLTK